jgi:hypothetical protein
MTIAEISNIAGASERRERVVAFVNSTFHVGLLEQNEPQVDVLVCMHPGLMAQSERLCSHFDAEIESLSLETFEFADLLRVSRTRARNRAIYAEAGQLLARLAPTKLIFFVEGKPIVRYLFDTAQSMGVPCELWEDGLNHYVDFFDDSLFYAKSLTKLAAGYYRPGLFGRRLPRERLVVRDRFRQRNLGFEMHDKPAMRCDRVLFIGQPLVDDKLVSERRYVDAICRLRDEVGYAVDYLAHPRERAKAFGGTGIDVVSSNGSAEAYCEKFDYLAFVSAFSTSNLNIGRFHKNYYAPSAFGLGRIAAKLRSQAFIPVKVVDSFSDIELSSE